MIDKEKAMAYLDGIGMVGPKNSVNVERLIGAMDVQSQMGAYKNSNRFTGRKEGGLTESIAWATSCPCNGVNRFLAKFLERFKSVYDAKDPKFASICTERTLDVLSPLQFLYLITMDFVDNFA